MQAAALLDWGFSLPADASVGRLVNPGEVNSKPSPSAAPLVAERQSTPNPPSGPTVTTVAVAGVVVLFAGLWSGLIMRARRRSRSARAARPPEPR
jgi:serine-type D-Ala-D-Ala carboxypeptidase (penicillin-binding protein 5/6)